MEEDVVLVLDDEEEAAAVARREGKEEEVVVVEGGREEGGEPSVEALASFVMGLPLPEYMAEADVRKCVGSTAHSARNKLQVRAPPGVCSY
jgi:hypothetical protein